MRSLASMSSEPQVSSSKVTRSLGDALPDDINDQYLVVGKPFIIVEKNTRRIIAIVPMA